MVPIRFAPTTKAGKPSSIEAGSAVLSVPSGNATARLATQAEIDADVAAGGVGLVGFILSEDTAGTSQWQGSGDADLGSGVETIVDGGTYTYNDPNAVNLGASSGAPVPKVA